MHSSFYKKTYHGLHRFDFDKFISAIQDVKQGVNERLRQWAEYEAQLEKLINWLGDSEVNSVIAGSQYIVMLNTPKTRTNVNFQAALKNYCHKSSMEEKQEQVERFKVRVFFVCKDRWEESPYLVPRK